MRYGRIKDSESRIKMVASPDGENWHEVESFSPEASLGARIDQPFSLCAPISPPAIFGIGQNYRKHAEEMGSSLPQWPVVFMKNPSSVTGPTDKIQLPTKLKSTKVDFEAELAIVIGKPCKNATLENAHEYVLGFTCANDISARDWQKEWSGGQFSKGKGFDTFCPIGPWIASADELGDPQNLKISSILNGSMMQDWTTGDMIFSIAELIVFLSGDTTLLPGTLILTGTPHGVGTARTPPIYLQPGDEIQVQIEGIGGICNPVTA